MTQRGQHRSGSSSVSFANRTVRSHINTQHTLGYEYFAAVINVKLLIQCGRAHHLQMQTFRCLMAVIKYSRNLSSSENQFHWMLTQLKNYFLFMKSGHFFQTRDTIIIM